MGLCKCPKRKVTNQFCYEHRVNVCEYCMVTNHSECIVLSYLKWLQDGDYNPVCEICSKKLNEEDCIRLVCYHVFHWHCLDHFAKKLPPTTAPAGYTCPTCSVSIFPPLNLVSPVADVLRERLQKVNWARAGLGLPLAQEVISKVSQLQSSDTVDYHNHTELKTNDTIVHIEESNHPQFDKADVYENKFPNNIPRRLTKKLLPKSFDHDENKYERKTMAEKLNRWHACAENSRYFHFYFRNKYRRYVAIGTFLFVGFFFLMLILEKLSGNRNLYEDDSEFNPMLNSYVKINEKNS